MQGRFEDWRVSVSDSIVSRASEKVSIYGCPSNGILAATVYCVGECYKVQLSEGFGRSELIGLPSMD